LNYRIHPAAEMFPRMPGDEFVALKQDIRANGLIEPIWLLDDQILDGRHRYYACQEVGVTPSFREYQGDDAAAFVVSLNLKRRHLSESQRAAVAVRLANMPQGARTDIQPCANLRNVKPISQPEAADMLQVSRRSVQTAARIERDAPPEVFQAVQSGALSLNLAAAVSELPAEEKAIVAASPVEEIKETAKAVVKAHVANNSGNNEWYTPAAIIESARLVMGGIDTDPATSELANQTVGARQIFTAADDGRTQQWFGNVWMNPPYAQPLIGDFADAVTDKYACGEIEQATILVNNATETKWFQKMLEEASAVCFPASRIRFIDPEGKPSAPLQGQAIVYMGRGDSLDMFIAEFRKLGSVMVTA